MLFVRQATFVRIKMDVKYILNATTLPQFAVVAASDVLQRYNSAATAKAIPCHGTPARSVRPQVRRLDASPIAWIDVIAE